MSERPALARTVGVALLIVAVVALAYVPAFGAGFIWDDDSYVTENPVLRDLEGLGRIWLEPTSLPQWYPLVHTTFWIEYQLWELHPTGYHVVNVLLHALSAVVLWRLLLLLRVRGALFAALVFAVHPVQVESVAWVTERKNVLSLLFALLATRLWLRVRPLPESDDGEGLAPAERPRLVWALALACFVGALLSKTVTSSLPAVFLLLVWWQRGRIARRDVVPLLPWFAIGLAFAAVTALLERSHVGAEGELWQLGVGERLQVAGHAVWFYLGKLLLPIRLTFSYERWAPDAADLVQWLWPITWIAFLGGLLAFRRRIGRGPLTAALIFSGVLVPALGFFNVFPFRYSFVADHFQYHADVAVLVALATGLAQLADRVLTRPTPLRMVAGGALVALLGTGTFLQSRVYEGHETLWRDTLAKNPASWLAHTNLAKILLDRGDAREAIPHLQAALGVDPEAHETHLNLGVAYVQIGDPEAAKAEFAEVLRIKPDSAHGLNNLAYMLREEGDCDAAIPLLERALAILPAYASAHLTLAACLRERGDSARALEHLRKAIAREPGNADARVAAAACARELARPEESVPWAASALAIAPDLREAQAEVVAGLLQLPVATHEERIPLAERALREAPAALPPVLASLGEALAGRGANGAARQAFTRAAVLARSAGRAGAAQQYERRASALGG